MKINPSPTLPLITCSQWSPVTRTAIADTMSERKFRCHSHAMVMLDDRGAAVGGHSAVNSFVNSAVIVQGRDCEIDGGVRCWEKPQNVLHPVVSLCETELNRRRNAAMPHHRFQYGHIDGAGDLNRGIYIVSVHSLVTCVSSMSSDSISFGMLTHSLQPK